MERLERGKSVRQKEPEVYYVNMNWAGANQGQIEVVAGDRQPHYITYGTKEKNAYTFKKLTYKNVYNHIDVEFIIPKNKNYGIKYSLIVHPGADPDKVKILYTGAVKKIKTSNGSIVIKTPLYDITEHEPFSFGENEKTVSSAFHLVGDTVKFSFPDGYDKHKTLTVDPWVTSTNTPLSQYPAYDVDYDYGGNTFFYGGTSPWYVSMYNTAGVLQWTFSGVVSSVGWTGAGPASNFGVNKLNSKTYVGQGVVTAGAQVIRLDAVGNYDNFITVPHAFFREIWDFGFHCSTADVFIMGGGTNSNNTAATINNSNASLQVTSFNPAVSSIGLDVVSHAIDNAGNLFVIYAGNGLVSNKITAVNSTFNGNNWTSPTTFTVLTENTNKAYYLPTAVSSNGFNALAVNNNYVYYYDGTHLGAYSKINGTPAATVAISGSTKSKGGIAVDDCDNIYIGDNGSILTYSFNGSTFASTGSISLNVSSSNPIVYDIALNKNSKTLYVCGNGFVGNYSATPSLPCPTASSQCLFSQPGVAASTTSITCSTLGSATITCNGGVGPYTYTWIPSNQTGSVGTGLSPGTYTILVFDAGNNQTYTTNTTFVSPVPLNGSVSVTNVSCFGGSNGSASITNISGGSGNYTYTWTIGSSSPTTSVMNGLTIGNYSVTMKDALTSCVLSKTFQIQQPTSLSITIVASSPTACAGQSINLLPQVSGGTPSYTYSWVAGPNTLTYNPTSLTPGAKVFTITVHDANNCIIADSISVTFIANPPLNVTHASICPGKTGTISVNGSPSYVVLQPPNLSPSSIGYNTSTISFTGSPLATQIFTVVGISAQGCTAAANASLIVYPFPIPTLGYNTPVCNGLTLNLSASGGNTYQWSGPGSFTSSLQNPSITPAQVSHSGTYSLVASSVNNCTALAVISVTVHPTPALSATGSTICANQTLNLSATTSTGVGLNWSGPAGFSSNLPNPTITNPASGNSGSYSVVASSAQGCTNQAVLQVTVTDLPSTLPLNNGPKCELIPLLLNGSVSTGALSYSWQGPGGFTSALQNPTLAAASVTNSGTYTLSVYAGPCVVSGTTQVTVYPLPTPTVISNSPVCETKFIALSASTPNTNTITSFGWHGPQGFNTSNTQPQLNNAQAAQSGIYTVTVFDSHYCSATVTVAVVVYTNPVVTAVGDTVCLYEPAQLKASGAASYKWYNAFYPNLSAQSFYQIPSVTSSVTSTYSVVGASAIGCTAVAQALIKTRALPQPSILVVPQNTLCMLNTFTLEGVGGYWYAWSGPAGYNMTGRQVNVVTSGIYNTGDYSLTAYDYYGCRATVTTSVTVYDLPHGMLSGMPKDVCAPYCGQNYFVPLAGSASIISVSWNMNSVYAGNETFRTRMYRPGTYIFEGRMIDEHGCINTTSMSIIAHDKPLASFSYIPELPVEDFEEVLFQAASGNTVSLSDKHIVSWQWALYNDAQSTLHFSGTTASHLYKNAGTYPVALMVENTFGCTDTSIQTVHVLEDAVVYVPNAFTPNSDNKNDNFVPVVHNAKEIRFDIFDRWGTCIFTTTEPGQGWDGKYKGDECKQDVYVWKLFVRFNSEHFSGNEKTLTGHVLLYR